MYAGINRDTDVLISHALEESEIWYKLNKEQAAPSGEKKWSRPQEGVMKCNIHSDWTNAKSMCGGAWIVRDSRGETRFHARDAFLPAGNRLAAELRGLIWAMKSMQYLRIVAVEFWTKNNLVIEALYNPKRWPGFIHF